MAAPFPPSAITCGLVLVAGNWKMFKGPREAAAFCAAFEPPAAVDVVLCPPYVSLETVAATGAKTYAQSVHWASEGAFTGEVSAPMLAEVGAAGAIVGHSERRQYFGETDETVARRAYALREARLGIIACVGESAEERKAGQTEFVLRIQVEAIADAVGGWDDLVIAYEPVWAIGTGVTATPDQAQEAHAYVKSIVDAPVLYGGSVKPDNAAELAAQPDVDGFLVGGASLEVDSFTAICQAAAASRS
jgi:triosephosphate isomerase